MIFPEDEIEYLFTRSGGHGGQNVNKTSTRVQLRWNVLKTKYFSPDDKIRLSSFFGRNMTENGEVIVTVAEERSQFANREKARKKLAKMLEKGLQKKKFRIPTKPSRSSKLKRLEGKKKQSLKKQNRKTIDR